MIKFRTGVKIKSGIKIGVPDNAMILVYEIPSPNTNIELAIQANSSWFSAGQSVNIDWGDGSAKETVSATSGQSGYIGHTYASAGTYTIRISGSMKRYGRHGDVNIAGETLLTRVDSFGKLGLTSLSRAFRGCTGLTSVPKTLPSEVTDMYVMFSRCSGDAFNPDVSNWDVSKVTDMAFMFYNCYGAAFNPDVSNWNVSKVTDMRSMFYNCYGAAFNGGRGPSGAGIKNWILRSGDNAVSMLSFMLYSKKQEDGFLDDILNTWAARLNLTENPLPTNITVHFGANTYTSAGLDAYTLLTKSVELGGAGWTISSGGLV